MTANPGMCIQLLNSWMLKLKSNVIGSKARARMTIVVVLINLVGLHVSISASLSVNA